MSSLMPGYNIKTTTMSKQKYDLTPYLAEFNDVPRSERTIWLEHLAKKIGASFFYTRTKIYELRKKALDRHKEAAILGAAFKPQEPPIELSSEEKIVNDKLLIRERSKSKEAETKYKILLEENTILEQRLEFLLNLRELHTEQPILIVPKESEKNNVATPIILLSDWHFEETVESNTINEINEYSLEIAQKRWFNCIQNSLWLVNNDRNHSHIDTLIVWLGGDFITGHIHKELVENNSLSPTHAARFAKRNIISGLKFYLDYGKFKRIVVVCNQGNHGRDTDRVRVSTNYKHSYEWAMYHDIADYFKEHNETRIEFKISDGFFNYVEINGFVCRFFHGDLIKYQGGIGGLTIPLIKAIHRMNTQIKADYNFMGHFHNLFQATKDCIVNGSGIGYNAYAQFIGASPEPPMQSYNLIDSKRGLTIKAPIFCT